MEESMFEKAKKWLCKHRKGVIITVSVLAITGTVAILLINGKKVKIPVKALAEKVVPEVPQASGAVDVALEAAMDVAPQLSQAAETVTIEIDGVYKVFPRTEFIRQLHEGWQASPEKLAQAAAMGIDLKQGETIVNACMVKMRAA